jgi:CRISPR/Cas system-associated exonuclease Cas4 (RecB family)
MELAERIKQSFFSLLDRPRTPKSIHVSALPFCLRKEFFNIRFNANPLSTEKAIAGRIYHLALRHLDVFDSCEFEKEVELEVTKGYRIRGRVDVYDFVHDEVYEFKFSEGMQYSEAVPFYFAQANAYACMLSAKKFYLVLVNPKMFDVKVLEGEPDESAYEALKQRAIHIVDCLESNTIPPGPEKEWECKNCVYNIVCSNLKDEQKRLGDAEG